MAAFTNLCYIAMKVGNCTNGDIRLVDGSNELEGRVELCYDNQWGTVCYNSYWTPNFANLVCGQLGFSSRGTTKWLLHHTVITLCQSVHIVLTSINCIKRNEVADLIF